MTQLAEQKRWLNLAEAAEVAGRTERTMRNWVRDGVLKPPIRGFFDRDTVLAAERNMRNRRGRPPHSAPQILQISDEAWIKVQACGAHAWALEAGMIALNCSRCQRKRVDAPDGHYR